MLRFLILEVLLPILVLALIRGILRSIFQSFKVVSQPPPQAASRQAPPVQMGGELKKDPVCGTYVSESASVTKKIDGELVHFCSKECRDRYVRTR